MGELMDLLAIETPNMRALADAVRQRLTLESYRQRQPREADGVTWAKLCDLTAANLAQAEITGSVEGVPLYVATRLQKVSQYLPDYLRSKLISLLIVALSDSGLAAIEIDPRGVHMAHPSEYFRALMAQCGVGAADMKQEPPAEVIVLKYHGSEGNELRGYKDTEETIRARREVQRINARLASAVLSVDGMPRVPTWRRYLRRQFATFDSAQRFDRHGRCYGPFWLGMKRDTRPAIRIDGEPIADLDFRSLFPNLLYLGAGLPLPAGDPYLCPPFEAHRDGVKRILNAMLNAPVRGWPKDTQSLFPPHTRLGDVKGAILARHPVMRATLRPWLGFELMYTESRILVAALLDLDAQGIVALPMHDGAMVAASRADVAAEAMAAASERVTGVRLPVERKL